MHQDKDRTIFVTSIWSLQNTGRKKNPREVSKQEQMFLCMSEVNWSLPKTWNIKWPRKRSMEYRTTANTEVPTESGFMTRRVCYISKIMWIWFYKIAWKISTKSQAHWPTVTKQVRKRNSMKAYCDRYSYKCETYLKFTDFKWQGCMETSIPDSNLSDIFKCYRML